MIYEILTRIFSTAKFMLEQNVPPIVVLRTINKIMEDFNHIEMFSDSAIRIVNREFLEKASKLSVENQSRVIVQMYRSLVIYKINQTIPDADACIMNTLRQLESVA